MKNLKTAAIAGLIVLAAACSKDNGNYDYTNEADAITISNYMRVNEAGLNYDAFMFKMGEDVIIPAKYTINDPTLTEKDILFEWFFGDEVVSNEPVLNLGPQAAGLYTGLLQMTDLRYGMKYALEYSFRVSAKYTDGWAILTEKDGQSYISYLNVDPKTGDYVYEENSFGKANQDFVIPAGVWSMDHHMYDTYPQVFALTLVAPGNPGAIDISINDMSVYGKFKNEFTGGTIEKDLDKVSVMQTFVAATDTDGKLYLRKEATQSFYTAPHASLFPSYPVVLEDGPVCIKDWVSMTGLGNMIASVDFIIGYDSVGERCVYITEGQATPLNEDFFANAYEPHRRDVGFDGTNSYPDIVYPDPDDLSDYEVLKMNGCGWDCDLFADPALSVVMLLKHKTTGKLYIYTYRFFSAWGSVDVDLDLFFPVPENINIDPKTMYAHNIIGGPDSIVYFTANGNKDLYYFNAIRGTFGKVYSSSSPITAVGQGQVQGYLVSLGLGEFSPYIDQMVIGCEDGSIKVFQMDAAARISGNPKLLYTVPNTLGAMKFATYLPNDSTNF